ncbi:MAG: riboflavin synthase [Myxococcales bacterium]|nr:riboflavin synthase [Myxococcales bacterium]
MFTGLVRSVGRVASIEASPEQRTFVVAAALSEGDRTLGASVSVSGVCLTVTAATPESFTVVAAFETLAVTSLGDLKVGDPVNLEPALRVGDALGGHLVSGHVDGLGRLRSREPRGDAVLMWFDAPAELLPFVATKGSICVDGVSLTINDVDAGGFAVGLIPHTLAVTTLGARKPGDAVNLEVDLLARYVARLLATTTPAEAGVTRELLARSGFLHPSPTKV